MSSQRRHKTARSHSSPNALQVKKGILACAGLSLSPSHEGHSRQAGYRDAEVPRRHLCTWLLLASPRRLPLRHGSSNSPRILGGQVRCKCDAGCSSSVCSSGSRLAHRNSLGVRPADRDFHCANTGDGGFMALTLCLKWVRWRSEMRHAPNLIMRRDSRSGICVACTG